MENEIVIQVEIDSATVKKELAYATAELQNMKQAQSQLNAEFKAGKRTAEEYGTITADNKKKMTELAAEIKNKTALVAAASIEEIKSNATLDQKRAALNALQKAYGSLTEEQRNAEIQGKTLTERIKDLSDAVKEEESAIGDNRRNVGNYAEALRSVIPGAGKVSGALTTLKKVAMLAAGGFGALAAGVKAALASMLKFLATPAGMIIAAIAVALGAVVKAFQKLNEQIKLNDEASTGLARVYAVTIQPIVDTMTKIFGKLADVVGKVANKFADWASQLTGAAKTADDYVKSIDNLEEAERQYTVQSAERSKQVAELRSKSVEADKYSVEERRKFLQEALELEKDNLEDEKKIKAERLRILEETAKKNADTSDAMKDKIAQARADMLRAEEAYYTGTRRMQSQLQSFNKEIDTEDQKRLEEYKKRLEERKAAAIEAYWTERETREAIESAATKRGTKQAQIEREKEDDAEAEAQLERQLELAAKMREMQKTELQKDFENEMAWLDELHEAKLLSEADFLQQKADLQKEFEERARAEQMEAVSNAIADWGSAVLDTIGSISDAISAAENAELDNFKKGQDERKKALDKRLKAGEISQEEYAERTAEIDEQTERREIELQREQAKREKALGIMSATISTAAAIIGFLAKPGGIPGVILSAMAGITGAAQIAAIAAEPLPRFESGGVVPGESYTGDNVLVRANSGEGIYTNRQANNILQEVANNPARGGIDYERLAATMAEAVAAQPAPVVVYKEMQEFGDKVATYDELAKI